MSFFPPLVLLILLRFSFLPGLALLFVFFLIFFSRGCNGSEEEEDLRRLTDEDEEMAEDFGIVVDSMVVDDVVVADDVVVTGDVVVVNDVVMTDDTVVEDDSSTFGF